MKDVTSSVFTCGAQMDLVRTPMYELHVRHTLTSYTNHLGKPAVIYHGTVHAREWITSMVCI
jgi:hypothetical protein